MAIKRRDFIKKTALAAGSFFIVPRHVLGRGFIAPSDKLNIAAVGAGGKGTSDILNAWDNGKNNVVALCDVDWVQASKSIAKFPDAKKYRDFRTMFDENKDIDAVTISTPDHTHATIAMAAMQLGKHVYVQKPLAHNIFEARTLTEAARKQKVVTQMGNQGASGPGVHQMVKWFDQGLIGKVHTVHVWTNRPVWPQGIPVPSGSPAMPKDLNWDAWVGPASLVDYHPGYHPFKWRGWWNFGTGALGDMACHLMDPPYRVLGLGYPTEVECSVGSVFLKDWVPEHIPLGCPPSSRVQLKFPASKKNKSAVTLTWHDGGLRPFHPEWVPDGEILGDPDGTNGSILIGTKGVMVCGTYGRTPKVFLKNGQKIDTPPVDPIIAALPEHGHQVAWADACKAGFNSDKHKALHSSFDYAGPLTESILMGNLAIRSYGLRVLKNGSTTAYDNPGRRKLLWDGTNMRITNFEDANQFVKREYREGWKL